MIYATARQHILCHSSEYFSDVGPQGGLCTRETRRDKLVSQRRHASIPQNALVRGGPLLSGLHLRLALEYCNNGF